MRKKQAELDYRRAFQVFSEKTQQVQALTGRSGSDLETALIELQQAHVEYQRCRDIWVKQLLVRESDQVRAVAQRLWESAGRPEGTAAEDWRRAEAIVEKSAAVNAA
jgi:hypothetical protein